VLPMWAEWLSLTEDADEPIGEMAEMIRRDVFTGFRAPGRAMLRLGINSDKVRSVFENAPRYLDSRQVDIRVRAETVKEFAATREWQRLLDIGCGDGTISLPLLTPTSHLTLLDLSGSMVEIAKSNIPEHLAANVEVRNEDFMKASFDPASFDLVISVGVMAHVESPDEFLSAIAKLLRPGGSLIIEFTDCRHIVGRLGRFFGTLQELVAPPKYRTNRLSFSEVAQLFKRHRMRLVSEFRYATVPIPGIERFVGHDMLYRIVELTFGRYTNKRNSWLGNEYICLLTVD
jgi:SAM-dependent methyltransferase